MSTLNETHLAIQHVNCEDIKEYFCIIDNRKFLVAVNWQSTILLGLNYM